LLAHGQWFSPGTPASSATKTGHHAIAEILLKVTLNTINQIILMKIYSCHFVGHIVHHSLKYMVFKWLFEFIFVVYFYLPCTVNLFLFVEYQLFWFSLVSLSHKIKYTTKCISKKRWHLTICLSMKIDTNKNNWVRVMVFNFS
jgi:hypothetical protein